MSKRALVLAGLGLGLGVMSGSASASPSSEIRYGTRVVANGVEGSSGYTAYMCARSGAAGTTPKYFTKTTSYAKDVDVYLVETTLLAPSKEYTIKPNGDVNRGSLKIGRLVYSRGVTTTVTYYDAGGNKKGSVSWSPASGGIYNASGAVIGSYGSAADGDMRMLALTFFYLAPLHGC